MKAYDIERYINGELEGEELHQFEILLNSDPVLQEEVDRSRILLNQLKQLGLSEKIKRAQQINKEVKKWRTIFFICVLSLGILFFIYYFWKDIYPKEITPSPESQKLLEPESEKQILISDSIFPEKDRIPKTPMVDKRILQKELPLAKDKSAQSNEHYEEIAMNYYSTPEEFAYLRGMASQTIMDSARMEFNNEKYQETMNLLNSMNESDNQVNYFKAHVFFKMHNFDQANILLEKCLKQEKLKLKKEEMEWYLLLNNIACGKKCFQLVKQQFKIVLSNSGHSYYKASINLQKVLKLN